MSNPVPRTFLVLPKLVYGVTEWHILYPFMHGVPAYPGRSVPLDVCSVTSNGQLMMFSGCLLNYGMHNISLLPKPEDLSWLDSKISSLGKKFTKKYVRRVCAHGVHVCGSACWLCVRAHTHAISCILCMEL